MQNNLLSLVKPGDASRASGDPRDPRMATYQAEPSLYSDEWIHQQIKKELGYTEDWMYKDADDKLMIDKMNNLDA